MLASEATGSEIFNVNAQSTSPLWCAIVAALLCPKASPPTFKSRPNGTNCATLMSFRILFVLNLQVMLQ